MKRNFTDSLTRTTAGCLPVPIFNQKKRSRQPLTSNPQKNESSCGSMDNFSDPFDFFPLSGDFACENRIPDVPHQEKAVNLGSKGNRQTDYKEVWNAYECTPLNTRSNFISDSEMLRGEMSTFGMTRQQRVPEQCKKSSQTRILPEQKWSSTSWPNTSNTATSKPQNHKSYTFKNHSQQTTVKENKCVIPEGSTSQKVSAMQLKFNEKANSLRIISAVIESLKIWSQYTDRAALLFEVLATLDSAVISGMHGAKTFILRDGKDTVPCIFYETDRELPRLIRGRVHRCMGNYDKKRNLFKCVSVRPASVAEQRAFPEFLKASDAEIKQYVKSLNEV